MGFPNPNLIQIKCFEQLTPKYQIRSHWILMEISYYFFRFYFSLSSRIFMLINSIWILSDWFQRLDFYLIYKIALITTLPFFYD